MTAAINLLATILPGVPCETLPSWVMKQKTPPSHALNLKRTRKRVPQRELTSFGYRKRGSRNRLASSAWRLVPVLEKIAFSCTRTVFGFTDNVPATALTEKPSVIRVATRASAGDRSNSAWRISGGGPACRV